MGLRDEPMIWYRSGMRPASARWNSPGRSLRRARSPVAPNTTMMWLPGRGRASRARPGRGVAEVISARVRTGDGPTKVAAVVVVVDMAGGLSVLGGWSGCGVDDGHVVVGVPG